MALTRWRWSIEYNSGGKGQGRCHNNKAQQLESFHMNTTNNLNHSPQHHQHINTTNTLDLHLNTSTPPTRCIIHLYPLVQPAALLLQRLHEGVGGGGGLRRLVSWLFVFII